jgi:hypothetical protein
MTDSINTLSKNQLTASVETRVMVLEARLGDLKDDVEKKEKSKFKRISEWGGLLALALSITLGVFSIIDKSIWEPTKLRESSLSKLQDIVGQITKVNAELASLATKLSPAQLAPIGSTQNVVKYTLAKQGAVIIDRYTKFVNTETILLFSNEFLQSQNLTKAEYYADLGLKAAEDDFMRAVSKRYSANAKMLSQNEEKIAEARVIFDEALGYTKSIPKGLRYWVIGNIYRDWTIGEAINKQCDKAGHLYKDMRDALSAPMANQVQLTISGQILTQIQMWRMCELRNFTL